MQRHPRCEAVSIPELQSSSSPKCINHLRSTHPEEYLSLNHTPCTCQIPSKPPQTPTSDYVPSPLQTRSIESRHDLLSTYPPSNHIPPRQIQPYSPKNNHACTNHPCRDGWTDHCISFYLHPLLLERSLLDRLRSLPRLFNGV